MFHRILVPVDGSPTSMLAVHKAAGLAKAFDSKLTVVTVIDAYPFVSVGAEFAVGQSEYLAAATANAHQALAKAEAALSVDGLACDKHIIEGHVLHEGILQAAASSGADLIVMGSHGRHGIEKLLLGSTAARVLAHSPLPVLVVRGAPGER